MATDAASEGLNLQRLSTLINIDLPWNPARLEQRKGRIDRIGQLASTIEVLNLRYRGSVEDDVHRALSGRLQAIRDVFGTVPDTLEDVWVLTALGNAEDAKRRMEVGARAAPLRATLRQRRARVGVGALHAGARRTGRDPRAQAGLVGRCASSSTARYKLDERNSCCHRKGKVGDKQALAEEKERRRSR